MKITRKDRAWRVLGVIGFLAILTWVAYTFVYSGDFSADAVTATATLLTVFFLFIAWRTSHHESEDAERPHLSVILQLISSTHRVLSISNSGKTTAVKARLRLRGVKSGLRLESAHTSNGEVYFLDETPLFTCGADIPAGWLYEFLLPHGSVYAADLDELKHPRKFTIDVCYESLRGTRYEDEIPIDIGAHKHSIVPSFTSAERINKLTRKLAPSLKEIKNEIQEIRRTMQRH